MVPVVQVLEMGMQCLRGHHIEVKRELTGKPPPNVDGHRWRAAREKVSFVFAGLEKSFYSSFEICFLPNQRIGMVFRFQL